MPGEYAPIGAGLALDAVTGRTTITTNTTYLLLATAPITDADTLSTISELTTPGYTRQVVAWSAPSGTPRTTRNLAQLSFGPLTVDPPEVSYAALVTVASGTSGDIRAFWAADASINVPINNSIVVPINSLSISQT